MVTVHCQSARYPAKNNNFFAGERRYSHFFQKTKGLVGIHVRLTWFSSAAFWCSQRCVENKSTGDFSMVKRRHAGMNHRIFFGNSRMGIDHGTPKTALYNGKHTQNDGKIHHFYEVNQLFRLGHFQ
jgi:hypothetical protein